METDPGRFDRTFDPDGQRGPPSVRVPTAAEAPSPLHDDEHCTCGMAKKHDASCDANPYTNRVTILPPKAHKAARLGRGDSPPRKLQLQHAEGNIISSPAKPTIPNQTPDAQQAKAVQTVAASDGGGLGIKPRVLHDATSAGAGAAATPFDGAATAAKHDAARQHAALAAARHAALAAAHQAELAAARQGSQDWRAEYGQIESVVDRAQRGAARVPAKSIAHDATAMNIRSLCDPVLPKDASATVAVGVGHRVKVTTGAGDQQVDGVVRATFFNADAEQLFFVSAVETLESVGYSDDMVLGPTTVHFLSERWQRPFRTKDLALDLQASGGILLTAEDTTMHLDDAKAALTQNSYTEWKGQSYGCNELDDDGEPCNACVNCNCGFHAPVAFCAALPETPAVPEYQCPACGQFFSSGQALGGHRKKCKTEAEMQQASKRDTVAAAAAVRKSAAAAAAAAAEAKRARVRAETAAAAAAAAQAARDATALIAADLDRVDDGVRCPDCPWGRNRESRGWYRSKESRGQKRPRKPFCYACSRTGRLQKEAETSQGKALWIKKLKAEGVSYGGQSTAASTAKADAEAPRHTPVLLRGKNKRSAEHVVVDVEAGAAVVRAQSNDRNKRAKRRLRDKDPLYVLWITLL